MGARTLIIEVYFLQGITPGHFGATGANMPLPATGTDFEAVLSFASSARPNMPLPATGTDFEAVLSFASSSESS